ncbi:flagellar type III secretion system pore protein FliP [Thermanaerothrix sp. 4228-RoL]|uniref:Flagellar biosynthetic protein FliP n=2 Tax=Thermanaerothrix TaxID=1077886 RepID=A0ABU3NMS8_9CHLR|nr:flagellar type III secretion system pore protein FliP [Thermanaerothrix sp. 4228-RoL]MDT8897655.1 flagellar type III secretion system pore protein FliP [Thermanaerothrix sp. 4228-RoL]
MKRRSLIILFVLGATVLLSGCVGDSQFSAPGVTLTLEPATSPQQMSSGVQLLVLLTVLSLAPSILILATSFTRIVIVLSMLRNAIGTPTIPPNQVVIGLSLVLTFFIMNPVYNQIDQQAIQPYLKQEIDQKTAFQRGMEPLREFMFKQTREKDLQLFLEINGSPQPNSLEEIPTAVLLPAFVISELRTAFTMGFVLYIPFLVIDMVVSSILLSMGMMMLPPSLVSLPFKLLLFVMVDGWYLITRSLTLSFM